jgi:hypothetical protein
VNVPQLRRVHDLQNRPRALTIHAQARGLKQSRKSAWPEGFGYERKRHRLSWFETLQGLSFLAVVMFGMTHALASGLLICAGMAMCVLAILTTCCKGKTPKLLHLVFATSWAFIGAIHILAHMT